VRITGLPLVREGVKVYFSQALILRTYILIPAALAVALIATWPQGSLESVLRAGAPMDPFTVVAVAFLLFLVYLGGRYGSEEYSPDSLGDLREYVTLTPASVGSLVAGKAAFAVLHTAFLLALGAPFLLASLSVSGTPPGVLGAGLATLASAALAARMFGLFLLALLGQRKLLRSAAFVGGFAAYLVVTFLAFPSVNPGSALLALRAGDAAAVPHADLLAGITFAAAIGLAGATALVLAAARRQARAQARTGSRSGE
jgi:hypothetical protein